MLYYILWIIVRSAVKVHIRKVHLSGRENLPNNRPIIFACNHPNSFLDGMIISTMIPPKHILHFLVRSDVFRKKWANTVLRAVYQIPVYRRQEGLGNLHKNKETANEVTNILKKNNGVLVFSEGICLQDRKLKPLKKGTARMALESFSDGVDNLCIVPVGVNYSKAKAVRSEVCMNIGKAIKVSDYSTVYEETPAKAINDLTAKVEGELVKEVIHIDNPELEPEFEEQAAANRKANPAPYFPFAIKNRKRFAKEKNWANELNEKETITDFMESPKKPLSINWLILLITLPVFLLGQVLAFIPNYFAIRVTKQKVKLEEFIASVRLGVGMVFYLIQLLLLTIVLCAFMGWWGFLALLILSRISYWSFVWRDVYLDLNQK